MTRQTGLGAGLYVSGFDVSGDAQGGTMSGPNSPLDVTSIDTFAVERRKGQISGMFDWSIYFDDADDASHEAFSSLVRTDRILTYVHKTATIGTPAVSVVAKQIGYDPTRGNDGSMTFAVQAQSNNYGLEWGKMLTAGKRTDASATAPSTGVDVIGAAGSFGLQAFCHIFALTSGTPTIKLQESQAADGSGDAFADVTGGAFAINSAQTSERIQTARDQAVERYLRVTTTGTFAGLVFAVHVKVNRRETVF